MVLFVVSALILRTTALPLPLSGGIFAGQQRAKAGPVLARVYTPGEHLTLHMSGVNEDRVRTIRYSAQADGTVKQNGVGNYYEEFAWSDLTVNKRPQELTPASADFREFLSLSPDYSPTFPDLGEVQPMLIGPITDLLTFYVDLKLAMGLPGLRKVHDQVFVPYGKPSSWADGKYVVLGEDSIDFEVKLQSIDRKRDEAVVTIHHIPPIQPKLNLPSPWMQKPVVGRTLNNWVEVTRNPSGTYTAAVGKETFDVEIRVRLSDGVILSADQDNVVEVLERECSDSSLKEEGKPIRYRIHRHIEIR